MNADDAGRVLRILTAAFPTYPMPDDTVELYLSVMVKEMHDPTVAFAVAADWATTQLIFPKPAELLDAYAAEWGKRARRAKATAAGRARGGPGWACGTCKDVRWQFVRDVNGEAVHPCPDCDQPGYIYWQTGHMDSRHDIFACEHPRCEARAKAISKTRRSA